VEVRLAQTTVAFAATTSAWRNSTYQCCTERPVLIGRIATSNAPRAMGDEIDGDRAGIAQAVRPLEDGSHQEARRHATEWTIEVPVGIARRAMQAATWRWDQGRRLVERMHAILA
jgi:hypothetical protein